VKRVEELSEVIAKLKRLSRKGGSQLVHDEQFRRAVQKLEDMENGRTVGRKDVLRAVTLVVRVLCDEQLKRNETR
jgi:hypothetical protein